MGSNKQRGIAGRVFTSWWAVRNGGLARGLALDCEGCSGRARLNPKPGTRIGAQGAERARQGKHASLTRPMSAGQVRHHQAFLGRALEWSRPGNTFLRTLRPSVARGAAVSRGALLFERTGRGGLAAFSQEAGHARAPRPLRLELEAARSDARLHAAAGRRRRGQGFFSSFLFWTSTAWRGE